MRLFIVEAKKGPRGFLNRFVVLADHHANAAKITADHIYGIGSFMFGEYLLSVTEAGRVPDENRLCVKFAETKPFNFRSEYGPSGSILKFAD